MNATMPKVIMGNDCFALDGEAQGIPEKRKQHKRMYSCFFLDLRIVALPRCKNL